MANPFEMTPADPIGTLQDFRQQVARTASLEAKASMDKDDAQTQNDFRSVMKTISPNLPVVEQLGQIASGAVRTGRFTEAEKAISVMSVLENRDSLAEQRAARVAAAQATIAKTRIEKAMALYAGVSDPATKTIADDLYQKEFGVPSPLANQPFSPQLIKLARESQVKQIDEATATLRAAQAATIAADDRRQAAVAEAQINYYNARVEAVKKKVADGVKASGKLAEVKPFEAKAVEAKLLAEYPELEPVEFDLAAKEIAADAKEIQLRNKGSFADAMAEALDARAGQFTRLPGLSLLGLKIGKDKVTYKSKPPKPKADEAEDLPTSGDVDDLVPGKAYKNGRGEVKVWNGTGWE